MTRWRPAAVRRTLPAGESDRNRSPAIEPVGVRSQRRTACPRIGRATSKVDARRVDVCDTLPAALVFESAPGATFSKGRACWHLDVAKAGSTTAFKITAKVDADARSGVVKNVVVATAGNAGKVTARAPVTVTPGRSGVQGRVSAVTG